MSDSMRNLGFFSARRQHVLCVICCVLATLVSAIRLDSDQYRLSRSSYFIIPRGGDSNHRNMDEDDDDDDEERTRFWSLTSLFRLNANAKDDASTTVSPSSHLQRGNKRGGALAVRTSKSRTFVDVTPVSTASSRLIQAEDEVPDEISDDDEPIQPLEAVFGGDDEDPAVGASETVEMEEIEVIEDVQERKNDDESWSATDQIRDASITPTGESPSVDPDSNEEIEERGDELQAEGQIAGVQKMTDVEELHTIREDASVDETVAAYEYNVKDTELTQQEATEEKGMHSDATKLWWTNVWTEQTTEETPELEELRSDESDADLSEPVTDEVIREPIIETEAVEAVDDAVVQIQEVELEEKKELPLPPIMRRGQESQTLEITNVEVDYESMEEPSQEEAQPETSQVLLSDTVSQDERPQKEESPFVSSGYWGVIDRAISLGLSDVNPSWKLSRRLRPIRKATAHVTGLHGFISQKNKKLAPANALTPWTEAEATLDDDDLGMIQRRIAAIEIAKQNVAKRAAEKAEETTTTRRGFFRMRRRRNNQDASVDTTAAIGSSDLDESEISSMYLTLERKSLEEQLEDERRKERVQEIDRLILKGQKTLLDLQCEKDHLQRRPNPLYNYTTGTDGKTTRRFSFPPQELVDEYIDEMFANGRLERMNHTELWKNGGGLDDDEDESIGDDLFVPSADARKLYERETRQNDRSSTNGPDSRSNNGNGGGGSWLLRQNLGKGGSLGEKIGAATETAGYKAVCSAVMSALARSIAAIHGVNIMTHSDIRLYMEQSPDLPPVGKNVIPGSSDSKNYAQEAIMDAMRKGVTKRKKRSSRLRRMRTEEAFLQRDAVVETLLSHCQISAPLLKLFPLAWQRALLGNIVTLIAAVVSDFCDGIQLQILGHQLTFSFKPITEIDMIRHIGMAGNGFNHRRAKPEQFEAAIHATADDVSRNLQFLDRWHHRALGSGMLRAQIANLIARIVLTLADEVLSGAQMDLWAAQAGGPRMLAGLEYRVSPDRVDGMF